MSRDHDSGQRVDHALVSHSRSQIEQVSHKKCSFMRIMYRRSGSFSCLTCTLLFSALLTCRIVQLSIVLSSSPPRLGRIVFGAGGSEIVSNGGEAPPVLLPPNGGTDEEATLPPAKTGPDYDGSLGCVKDAGWRSVLPRILDLSPPTRAGQQAPGEIYQFGVYNVGREVLADTEKVLRIHTFFQTVFLLAFSPLLVWE